MSGLAHLLLDDEYNVRGLDKEFDDLYSSNLRKRGVVIDGENSKEYLKSDVVIIGHSFMNKDLLKELDDNHMMWFEYNEFLDFYIDDNKLVSICGSHGKTTLVNILKEIVPNTSYLSGDGKGRKKEYDQFFFLESCEYKNHFWTYNPKEVLITNIEYDHVDYFKSEIEYISSFNHFIKNANKVYINHQYRNKIKHQNIVTFGLNNEADYYATIKERKMNSITIDVWHETVKIGEFIIMNLGDHFVELFVSAIAFMNEHNIPLNDVQINMNKFVPSVQRFNEEEIEGNFINLDYAHHPSQIINNYEICKEKHQKHVKIAIFKGDRLSRITHFRKEIIDALSLFDKAYVLPLAIMENNIKEDSMILCSEKIKYIENISELKEIILPTKKYSISLMSSKILNKEREYLTNYLKLFEFKN